MLSVDDFQQLVLPWITLTAQSHDLRNFETVNPAPNNTSDPPKQADGWKALEWSIPLTCFKSAPKRHHMKYPYKVRQLGYRTIGLSSKSLRPRLPLRDGPLQRFAQGLATLRGFGWVASVSWRVSRFPPFWNPLNHLIWILPAILNSHVLWNEWWTLCLILLVFQHNSKLMQIVPFLPTVVGNFFCKRGSWENWLTVLGMHLFIFLPSKKLYGGTIAPTGSYLKMIHHYLCPSHQIAQLPKASKSRFLTEFLRKYFPKKSPLHVKPEFVRFRS